MTAQCSTLNLFGDQTLNGFLDLVEIELRWDLSASMVQAPVWLRWLNLRVSPRSISVDTHPYSQFE